MASKFDEGNWIIPKLGIFEIFFENFSGFSGEFFWIFFWRNILGEIFLEDFLWRIFYGGFFGRIIRRTFWEEFFVYIGIDLFVKILVICQDFI